MSYSILNITIAIILVLLTYFIYSKLIYPYYLSPLRNLPRNPNAIKHWVKNLYHTLTGRLDINLQLIQNYGPVVHIEDNFVLVQDNDFRKIYLTYKFKKDPIYSLLDINGPNLFSSMDKGFHVSRRRLISPAFSLKNLQKMEPTIYRVGSDSLIKYIESKLIDNKAEEIDLFQLFHSNTMDVITCLIFGTSLNTTWDREKAQYYNSVIEKTQKQMFFRLVIPFYNHVKLSMETLFKPMILDNIKKRRESNEVHYDILQSLIDSKDPENGKGLKDLEIVDECLVLLFGGMDTTANTMTWTLYEILKHPDVYKQVNSEILTQFPDLNQPITVEKAKSELKYLEACVLESMRKNPVASGAIVRIVPESGITISGHYLPPGTSVGLDIYAQQNDPSIWKSPEIFDISRWLGEERETNKSKLFNFGVGPTSCIGRELAWSEIFLVLANLLRHFELEAIDKVLTPNLEFVNRPKEKRFMVSVKRRSIY